MIISKPKWILSIIFLVILHVCVLENGSFLLSIWCKMMNDTTEYFGARLSAGFFQLLSVLLSLEDHSMQLYKLLSHLAKTKDTSYLCWIWKTTSKTCKISENRTEILICNYMCPWSILCGKPFSKTSIVCFLLLVSFDYSFSLKILILWTRSYLPWCKMMNVFF